MKKSFITVAILLATATAAHAGIDDGPEAALHAAMAYERAGDCAHAVQFYQRYLETDVGHDDLHERAARGRDRCEAAMQEPRHTGPVHHYGKYIAAADAAAVGLSLLVPPAGLATYLVAPVVIHLHEGNIAGALESVAARVGLPLLGAYLGDKAQGDCGDCDFPGPALAGAAVGMLAAMVIDDSLFAQTRAAPTVVATPESFTLGVAARF